MTQEAQTEVTAQRDRVTLLTEEGLCLGDELWVLVELRSTETVELNEKDKASGFGLLWLMNCGDQLNVNKTTPLTEQWRHQSKLLLCSCTNNKAFILVRMTGLLFWPFVSLFLQKKKNLHFKVNFV